MAKRRRSPNGGVDGSGGDTTTSSSRSTTLSAVQRLTEAERKLTNTLTTASRYLPTSDNPLLLPTPTNMDQVTTILAVARTFADRTSAPSGWNPMVPIEGFVTPNPLPHQLRGGQLAGLQLKQAQEERERKRKTAREEREKRLKLAEEANEDRKRKEAEKTMVMKDVKMEDVDSTAAAEDGEEKKPVDPKRRELDVMHEREDMVEKEVKKETRGDDEKMPTKDEAARQQLQQQAQKERAARAAAASASSNRREVPATMNLSESSSSEDEDDDDDDSE